MNDVSSRSHTIIQIHINRSGATVQEGSLRQNSDHTSSTLHLIDLAGSESAKASPPFMCPHIFTIYVPGTCIFLIS